MSLTMSCLIACGVLVTHYVANFANGLWRAGWLPATDLMEYCGRGLGRKIFGEVLAICSGTLLVIRGLLLSRSSRVQ